ncbi:MAG TPA: VacJ family lipoprotein [Smithellaceae bacterium]|nr:VacJ family lipoprotein [Smithellaceae bacterium]HRS88774.1 VacJ family lipoprotein [Smithellaceae bacterium]HRV25789.1 VacJ family lipoprotein [Smithellaceae bacterium]
MNISGRLSLAKYLAVAVMMTIFFVAVGVHASPPAAESSELKIVLVSSEAAKADAGKKSVLDEDYVEDDEYYDDEAAQKAKISDPIEPFNRVMYHFNDKLYFWVLKPAAQGYKFVVPEVGRVSVRNFFSNLRTPTRFVSCLLQADFNGAATEAGRFAINTIWGIGGLLDPSSGQELNLKKQDTDLGQTLGFYGVGHGFYIVWPIFGPSSPRDSADIVGDYFLYPVSYLDPFYVPWCVRAYEEVNSTSLRIGDYESLKDAAIDPYIAIRDAYAQYRANKVKQRKMKFESFWGGQTKKGNVEKQD